MIDKNKGFITFKTNNKEYSIATSHHASKRMRERNIDMYAVAGSIIALGPERIDELQKNNDEAIIIDKQNNQSVVIGFARKHITIITVIAKSNVFVKDNTRIYNI